MFIPTEIIKLQLFLKKKEFILSLEVLNMIENYQELQSRKLNNCSFCCTIIKKKHHLHYTIMYFHILLFRLHVI